MRSQIGSSVSVAAGGFQLVWLYSVRGERLLDGGDTLLVVGQVLSAILLLGGWFSFRSAAPQPNMRSATAIVLGCVLLQFTSLLCLWPVLSDDVLRYRMDGRLWLDGESHYRITPTERAAQEPGLGPLDIGDRLVAFPHLPTLYHRSPRSPSWFSGESKTTSCPILRSSPTTTGGTLSRSSAGGNEPASGGSLPPRARLSPASL